MKARPPSWCSTRASIRMRQGFALGEPCGDSRWLCGHHISASNLVRIGTSCILPRYRLTFWKGREREAERPVSHSYVHYQTRLGGPRVRFCDRPGPPQKPGQPSPIPSSPPVAGEARRGVAAAEMANPSLRGPLYGGGPLRSREGISTRSGSGRSGDGEIQLQIDPMHADLDEHITGLHRQIRQLKGVAQEIESEAKVQNDLLSQLQMTVMKAQAGLKNNMRRLNKSIIQRGSSHVVHVVLFALFCFFLVYLWSKFSRR